MVNSYPNIEKYTRITVQGPPNDRKMSHTPGTRTVQSSVAHGHGSGVRLVYLIMSANEQN